MQKLKSIWNSWADSAGQPSLSPCLFVLLLREGSGSCWLRRYLFCLLLQTSWRVLTADGPKWDKPEAAVCSCFLTNCRYSCQVICFIICYCGLISYLAFWKVFLLKGGEVSGCLTILPLAVQPVLLGGSCERLRNAYHGIIPTQTGRWRQREFLWNNVRRKWNI